MPDDGATVFGQRAARASSWDHDGDGRIRSVTSFLDRAPEGFEAAHH